MEEIQKECCQEEEGCCQEVEVESIAEPESCCQEESKPKGTCCSVAPTSSAKDWDHPLLHNVATKIVVDDPMFVPKYQTDGSACVDLVANIEEDVAGNKRLALSHRSTVVVDCGFSMELPAGYKSVISVRSSMAKHGLIVTNGPGIIDSDYRGRVQVIVTNVGKEIVVIEHGDRFAQMSVEPVFTFEWQFAEALGETERGEGGFGSTGEK